jgi:Holliday junction resolvase-like predicted endonuclease
MYFKNRKQKGSWAESLTQAYLEKQGWRVLHRNLRTPFAEVDIVVQRNNQIKLIEVKFKKNQSLPYAPVGRSQLQRLKWAMKWLRSTYPGRFFSSSLIIVTSCGIQERKLPLLYDES